MKATKTIAFGLMALTAQLLTVNTASAADVKTNGNTVTIRPDGGQAKVVGLEVINDHIIRLRATSKDELPQKKPSLMIVEQTKPAKSSYAISDEGKVVIVAAKKVKAIVSKETGEVTFLDASGNQLLKEAKGGKVFRDFTVPERELGEKGGPAVTEEMKHGLQIMTSAESISLLPFIVRSSGSPGPAPMNEITSLPPS